MRSNKKQSLLNKFKSLFVKKRKLLPALPREYDHEYYVENTASLTKLLHKSGYIILHRPYFLMKNSTHDVLTVNPFAKTAVDAAPYGEQPLTVQQFLELFDK